MPKVTLSSPPLARVDDVKLAQGVEADITAEQKQRLEDAGCEFASSKKEKEEAAQGAPEGTDKDKNKEGGS